MSELTIWQKQQIRRDYLPPDLAQIERVLLDRLPHDAAERLPDMLNEAINGRDVRRVAGELLYHILMRADQNLHEYATSVEAATAITVTARLIHSYPEWEGVPTPAWVAWTEAMGMTFRAVYSAYDAVVRNRHFDAPYKCTNATDPRMAIYEACYAAFRVGAKALIRDHAVRMVSLAGQCLRIDRPTAHLDRREPWGDTRVLPGSIIAAYPKTVHGWLSKSGQFFWEEHQAEMASAECTHCTSCGAVGMKSYNTLCTDCECKRAKEVHAKREHKPWKDENGMDDGIVFSHRTETYYNHPSSAGDVLGDEDYPDVLTMEDMMLVFCDPVYASPVDEDRWLEDLPEGESELPTELVDALNALNLVIVGGTVVDEQGALRTIKPLAPLSWYPNQIAVDVTEWEG